MGEFLVFIFFHNTALAQFREAKTVIQKLLYSPNFLVSIDHSKLGSAGLHRGYSLQIDWRKWMAVENRANKMSLRGSRPHVSALILRLEFQLARDFQL